MKLLFMSTLWMKSLWMRVICLRHHIGKIPQTASTRLRTLFESAFGRTPIHFRKTYRSFAFRLKKFTCRQYHQPLRLAPFKKPLPNMLKVNYPKESGRQSPKYLVTLWTHPTHAKRQTFMPVQLVCDFAKESLSRTWQKSMEFLSKH